MLQLINIWRNLVTAKKHYFHLLVIVNIIFSVLGLFVGILHVFSRL